MGILFLCISFFLCTACKTVSEKIAQSPPQVTFLTLPDKTAFSRKHYDEFVVECLETGTPASIKEAAAHIYAHGVNAEGRKDLVLFSRLMQFMYPLESVYWNTAASDEKDLYLESLTKVEDGIYPLTLPKHTFLENVIPALILTKGTAVHGVQSDLRKRLLLAREKSPQSVLLFYLFGLWYEAQNRIADAEKSYEIAWNKDNSCYPAGIRFVRLALLNNCVVEALHTAEILYRHYPDAVTVKILFAEASLAAGDIAQAEKIVRHVLKRDSLQKNAFFLQVRIHIKKKEYLHAAALLDQYGKKHRTDKTYLLLQTHIANEWSKNKAAAKRCLETAQALYPAAVDVLLACAEFCFNENDSLNGLNTDFFIDMLLKQDNNNVSALALLARRYLALNRWEHASTITQYLFLIEPSSEHLLLLARAKIGTQHWEECIELLKPEYESVALPSEAVIVLYLKALYGARKYDELQSAINRSLPSARSAEKSLLIYYQALLESSRQDQLLLLRSSLMSNPRNEYSLHALYNWYFEEKEYRKAAYYLKQVLDLNSGNQVYIEELENLNKLLAQ